MQNLVALCHRLWFAHDPLPTEDNDMSSGRQAPELGCSSSQD